MSDRTTEVAANASLQAIVDCVALPVWVVDHDGLVVLANPAALAALGFDALEELVGRNGHETVYHHRPDGTPYPAGECPVLEPARTGEPVHSEEDWFFRRDGTMFPVSFTAVPIELPTGRGVVVTFVDRSAQREAEQGLRERDAILAQVVQPVWVVDHTGCFHYVNPAAAAALGYDDPSQLIGRPGHATVHYKYPDGRPFPEEECTVSRARTAGASHVEHHDWLVRRDGSILPIAYSTAPFLLPGGLGAVTAFTDIEATLRAEEAARQRDVAAARAAELGAARRRIIEAADAARAQLTRDLHDGAQQQFVSALLTLQLAERTPDAGAAGRLRATAVDQTRQGIAELRDLAAGLHPAVLGDEGLSAAVGALAARMPIPWRSPSPSTTGRRARSRSASTSSSPKRSRRRQARPRRARPRRHPHRGGPPGGRDRRRRRGRRLPDARRHGLAGLADRIAALDGELELDSPPGGGTALRASLPLGS